MSKWDNYIDQVEPCDECYAQLTIVSDTVTPAEITEYLGVAPTSSKEKGKYTVGCKGRKYENRINGWYIESRDAVKSRDLRDHLEFVLNRIYAAKEKLVSLSADKEVNMTMYCSWWGAMHCGPLFEPIHMMKISELNLSMQMYFASYPELDD